MKKARQHKPDANPPCGPPQWLTIFNDLTTLLMVFFVLLFSLGNMDTRKFQNFQNTLQSAMGVLNAGRGGSRGVISHRTEQGATSEHAPESVPSDTGEIQLPDTEGLEAEYTAKGIRLVLDDHLLFPSGSAMLSPSGLRMLNKIGAVILPLNRFIRIEGHTDDLPIATRRYPSNWELSAARAISVVTFFVNEMGFDPSLFSAAGYGSSRPRVVNESPGKRAKNRRVEIILTHPVPSSPSRQAQRQDYQDNGGN